MVSAARDFSSAERQHEDAFHATIDLPGYLAIVAGLAVALLLGLSPYGARVVDLVARPFGASWPIRVLLGAVALSVISWLVTLGFAGWAQSVQRRYGLSTQDWFGWLLDQLRGLGIATTLTVLGLLVLVGLARAFPRTWWAWVGLAAAALVLVGSFVYPVVIEPVFNHFRPLPAGALRSSLVQLARSDGVPVSNVLVADASRRTTTLNAYVSGYGGTRRLVVYDTLVQRASPQQVRLVVAHELGHAKFADVLHGTLEGALAVGAGSCVLFLVLSWPPLLARAGAAGPGDPRAIALVLLVVAVFGLLAAPVQNLVSRRIEARADVHALDLTADPSTFAAAQRTLALANLSDLDPGPVRYGYFFTHPTAPQRIAMARDWARLHGVTPPASLAP